MKALNEYALINCNLIQVENNCKIKKCSIHIKDGKIEYIGTKTDFDCKTYDLDGKYVTAGLINLHVHLFGTGKPSKVINGGGAQKLVLKIVKTPVGRIVLDKIVAGNVKTQLLSGATTIRTVGDIGYSDVRTRNKVNKGKLVGPRMVVSGPAITAHGGHGDGTFAYAGDTPEELKGFVKKNVDKGVDFIKICVTGGVMDAKKIGEPGEVKMTPEQTRAVCEEAHKYGIIVASHTESPKGVEICCDEGVDSIEHGSPFNEEKIESFKQRNGAMVVTYSPALPLAKLSPSITLLNDMAVQNSQVVIDNMTTGAKQCLEKGITVGLGTDSSCPFSSQYATPNEVYFYAKHLGVSNAVALTAATVENAKILRMSNEIGSLEVGKSADFIVMKSNPLDDLKNLRTLDMVAVKGKIIENPVPKRNPYIDENVETIM